MGIQDWSNRRRSGDEGDWSNGGREGGGGKGDCSKREREAKSIHARGGLYAQATTFGLYLLQKGDHSLKEMNVTGIYVPL